jgi:hypothetical protein
MEETYQKGDYTIKIKRVDHGPNPRVDYDNLGTMACFHGRYDLGDKGHGINHKDYNGWDEMEKGIEKEFGPCVILPIYMYDHSGITINTTGFSCHWDSGQIGFIFISHKDIREEYGLKRVSEKKRKEIQNYLGREVEVYDSYLTGDIWGYQIEDKEGNYKDSCWDFIGDVDYCKKEAESMVEYYIENE